MALMGIPLIAGGIILIISALCGQHAEKQYKTKCLYTTAVIRNYQIQKQRLIPQVSLVHDGKERGIFLLKTGKFDAEQFPTGCQIQVSYVPKRVFYDVRMEEEAAAPYSRDGMLRGTLILGITLLTGGLACCIFPI